MTASVGAPLPKHCAEYDTTPSLGELNTRWDTELWQKATQCPACSSSQIKRFANLRHITYDRCKYCGFTFSNPIPPEYILSKFYNSSFYNNYRKLEAARIRTQRYFSVSFSNLHHLASWINIERSASILDFGCGPGSFIALLRDEFGYKNVEGLELNTASARVAQQSYGLQIASDISDLQNKQYDLVILIEVIEHIPNPKNVLSIVSNLLKAGGFLFITTDSVRNVPSRYFPSHSIHYTGLSHVSLFTETAMVEFLSQSGFGLERIETEASSGMLGNFVASPFYKLDFLSPQSDDDCNDHLYVPTKFGRMLGLQPRRSLPLPIRALRRIDRELAKPIVRIITPPPSEHLFVLARKEIL